MKVLLTHRPGGAYGYISQGWLNAFEKSGHRVARWDGDINSWNSFGPDLYIGCSGHRQAIPASRSTKIAIHVNPFGDSDVPGINENKNAIDWTVAQRPDVVFGYGHESDRHYWNRWTTQAGIPWVPMPTAGDSVVYGDNGTSRTTDIAYIGGYWGYKGKNIDRYLMPLLNRHKTLVRGWGDWPAHLKVAGINDDEVVDVLNRTKIGPCISEQHTLDYGIDVPERMWKVALCGALAVHDNVKNINLLMPNIIVASNPDDYVNKCLSFLKHDEQRIACAKAQKLDVLRNNTYYHRIATLVEAVGFKAEADGILEFAHRAYVKAGGND